ncbi:MAG: ABC transporter ATP-binding protein [Eubacteriales bacterium]|nr:ABC transporter ATP-binding protein [Eubacteriales bacterium]
MLTVEELSFAYRTKQVLKNVNLKLQTGQMICVLGENGSGKTTLFRCLMGLLQPQNGRIFYDDMNIKHMSERKLATQVAYIPQSHIPIFNFLTEDVVMMGAASRIGLFQAPGERERKRAKRLMECIGIEHLIGCGYAEISGGERQLVLIARALLSGAKILIMDEPTANLDYGNQQQIVSTMLSLCEKGYSVLVSIHHPQQVLDMDTDSLILHQGQVLAMGKTREVVTAELLSKVYHYPIAIEEIERRGRKRQVCFAE